MPRPRSELVVVVSAAATFGALMASYSAFKPVRDTLVLDGDPDRIPWLFTATFIAMLVLSPIWGALVKRGPRRVVPISFHVFALCAFGFAIANHAQWSPIGIGRVFYVWASVFNLFVVSVFWSLLSDLLGSATAKRLYGPIAAGGTIGTVIGPVLTKTLVAHVGDAGILAMSGVLLEVAVVGVTLLRRSAVAANRQNAGDPPVAGKAFDGLIEVVRSPYLRSIVGYVLCTSFAATFIYLAQSHIVHDLLKDRVARTDYFATVDTYVAIATLVVQVVLAGPLIGWFGPGVVLCVLPIVQVTGLISIVAAPSLSLLMVVLVVGKTATHGLTRPSRELLFTVISREDKYRAKNAIDTVGYRLGDFSGAWLGEGLAAAASGALVAGVAVLGVAWISLATLLGAGFRRRVEPSSAKDPP
ncbi:MAG: MFS transporter [Deltaproteobacteria bacterium]